MDEKGKLVVWHWRNSQLCNVKKDKYVLRSLLQGALPAANSKIVLESSRKNADQNCHLKSLPDLYFYFFLKRRESGHNMSTHFF